MTDQPAPIPAPDYSTHELLHTSWLVQDMFARHVLEHPALAASKEWQALAQEAQDRLWALYQAVGAGHLDRGPRPFSDLA